MAAHMMRSLLRNIAIPNANFTGWNVSLVCCSSTTAAVSIEESNNKELYGPTCKHQNVTAAEKVSAPPEYRFMFPEFLPKVNPTMRNSLREKLERKDMFDRRKVLDIPEFYVGTIMAVTVSDLCSPGKVNRFVGICIHRGGEGLRACFTLRNIVDHQGVEIMYEMYNPTIRQIEVLRLEKRLDDELFYLRDAPAEFSTFPFDMQSEPRVEGAEVPVNPLKVKLNPRPWHARWERKELRGVQDLGLPERFYKRAQQLATPWLKYDLMREYRQLIPEEEQSKIYADVHAQQMELGRVRADKERRNKARKPKANKDST